MRYKKARDIFPREVFELIQEYIDGEYVYVPRKEENRKSWGEGTNTKNETKKRNEEIYGLYQTGIKPEELARRFFLSEKSIQRIITKGKSAGEYQPDG